MQTYPSAHTHRAVLEAARAHTGALTLALVITTRGSSYRKAGALALIADTGLLAGCISGGCLEQDLLDSAMLARGDGRNRRLRFDTRSDEDRWFGSQTGCRGEIEVLLIPSAADGTHAVLQALLAADAAQQRLWLQVDTDDTLDFGCARPPASADALLVPIGPSPRLLLLGGGPEAPPLIALARTCGWHVVVVEHRERYLAQGRLQGADRVIAARPAVGLADLNPQQFDAVLCMSHLYDEDRLCLQQLAAAAPAWLGVVGPAQRRLDLLAELDPVAAQALAHLEGPVGVHLGSHGPEAMALAMLARLVQARAQQDLYDQQAS